MTHNLTRIPLHGEERCKIGKVQSIKSKKARKRSPKKKSKTQSKKGSNSIKYCKGSFYYNNCKITPNTLISHISKKNLKRAISLSLKKKK